MIRAKLRARLARTRLVRKLHAAYSRAKRTDRYLITTLVTASFSATVLARCSGDALISKEPSVAELFSNASNYPPQIQIRRRPRHLSQDGVETESRRGPEPILGSMEEMFAIKHLPRNKLLLIPRDRSFEGGFVHPPRVARASFYLAEKGARFDISLTKQLISRRTCPSRGGRTGRRLKSRNEAKGASHTAGRQVRRQPSGDIWRVSTRCGHVRGLRQETGRNGEDRRRYVSRTRVRSSTRNELTRAWLMDVAGGSLCLQPARQSRRIHTNRLTCRS